MPRDVGRDARDECRQPLQLVVAVVEAGNQQRDELEPDAHVVQLSDGVENRLKPAAKLAIVAVVEALEVDLVRVDPRPQILEHTRRAVAVRDEPRHQSGRARFLENRDRPLARDQRFVVRADDDLRAAFDGVAHEPFGRDVERRRHRVRIAQRLRRHPVLAITAVQIAAEHAEAVGERARMHVKERLFLDRVALHAARIAPRHHQPPALVEAHLAHAERALGNLAVVAARVAVHPVVVETVIELAFARARGEDVFQSCHVLVCLSIVRHAARHATHRGRLCSSLLRPIIHLYEADPRDQR